jgi:putative membrane protein
MSAFHMFAAVWVKEFGRDERLRPARFFRFVNEVPAMFMVLIVILVVVKPF